MNEKSTLLIVDDDQDLLRQLDFLLEDDFKISTVDSMKEALLLDLKQFEVFLVDVRLSETDSSNTEGLELVKRIRRENNSATIIVMSRYEQEEYERLAKEEAGADKFIRKPFTMDEFLEMIQTIKKEKPC